MEVYFEGSVSGYTKAITQKGSLSSIIALEGDCVPRMELGQKIVFKNENDNPTSEYPEQEYCINAFLFPFEDGNYFRILRVCSIEKYPSMKGNKNRGILIEPRQITVSETILE